MKVKLARIAGFCMGVREAMDLALEVSSGFDGPIFTYGPLIHNPSALELLREKGVEVLKEIPEKGEGTVIIRAHGITPLERNRLEEAGFQVIDGTCPRVIKVQSIAGHYAEKGFRVVVVGDKGHPEVKGILGHAGDKGILVSSEEELKGLSLSGPYIIVAQTTQDRERFKEWLAWILKKFPDGRIFDTICDSTKRRQEEVRRLASEVEAVIVVGGKKSANTKRLAEIVEEEGKEVFFVETERDIDEDVLRRFSSVGVTAGASTPNWVINGVLRKVEAIPGKDESIFSRASWRTLRFLHESNLWTGLSGASLCIGASNILGINGYLEALIAFFLVFAMHTLNRLINEKSGRFNDPLRTEFLLKYKKVFLSASILGVVAAFGLAFYLSTLKFVILLFVVALGLLYSVTRLKELPGSKTLFVAGAWATLSVLIPCKDPFNSPSCWLVLFFVFFLVILRDVLMEIIDLQGDRLVGRETMTILLGEEKVLKYTAMLCTILAVFSSLPSIFLKTMGVSFLAFPIAFLYGLFLVKYFKREKLGQNLRLELMVETLSMVFMVSSLILSIAI